VLPSAAPVVPALLFPGEWRQSFVVPSFSANCQGSLVAVTEAAWLIFWRRIEARFPSRSIPLVIEAHRLSFSAMVGSRIPLTRIPGPKGLIRNPFARMLLVGRQR
jgi:hypothetical protein